MANGSIQIYTSAGQAAPLAGVALTVLDENGAALAHLTADADGFAEAADLPAPDAAYSLDEANSAVRPYAIYSVEAVLDGWQTVVLNGVQVFDGQQTVDDMDLIEANEAFAAQSVAVGEALHFDQEKLNVNGGAIALGHPVGASGARILVTLLYAMKHRGAHKGLATLCIGGGMGCATIVEM